jgi:hypothetical protein
MTISVKWAFFEKSQTQNLSNCIKAYTQIQMFLENSDQDIDSDCNPGISHYRLFGYAKKALIRKRCMTGLKKFHLQAAAQKFGTRQCLKKPF